MKISKQFLPARRALLLAGAFILSAGALVAQADTQATPQSNAPAAGEMGRHRPGVERQVNRLTQVLSLSSDQQAQVKAILVAQRQQMEALHNAPPANGASATPQAMHEQMKSIHDAADAKINAVLNDEQKTKYAAWQQQRKQMMEERHHGTEGVPPPPNGQAI